MRTLVILLVFLPVIFTEQRIYEGFKVFRIKPSNERQVDFLNKFRSSKHVEFWTELRQDGHPVDIMVDSFAQKQFKEILDEFTFDYETIIENVETVFEVERLRQHAAEKVKEGRISFTQYHRYDEITSYLQQLATSYPETVTLETIGQTYEGRDMTLIKISTGGNGTKPAILMDAGIHGAEWIGPALALYIIQELVENTTNSAMIANIDWFILPVANPDGYEYAHESWRTWRKTRRNGTTCDGVDGNRNYGFQWGGNGSSGDECHPWYRGPSEFSEFETTALSNFMDRNKNQVKLYITVHSFGWLILYPWSWTAEPPANVAELSALGNAVAEAVAAVNGTEYRVGSSPELLYETAGCSDDWAKGVAGIELAYTIELPGGGSVGFDLPEDQIIPVVTEFWPGIVVYHDYIQQKFAT